MTVSPFTYSSPHSLTYSFLCFFVSPQEWTSFKHHHQFLKTYESKDEKSIAIFPKDSVWTENTWYKQKPKICNMMNALVEVKMIKGNKTEWRTQLGWAPVGGVCVEEEREKTGLKLSFQKTKIMASGPIASWQIDGETMEMVTDFVFLGSKITANDDCSHEIKRRLLLGQSRDITLLTKSIESKLWFLQ